MMQDSTKEHVKVKYRRPLEKPRTSGRRPLSPGHSIADLLKTEPTASPNDCDGGESDTDDAHVTLPKPINAQQPGSQRPNSFSFSHIIVLTSNQTNDAGSNKEELSADNHGRLRTSGRGPVPATVTGGSAWKQSTSSLTTVT
ncbi:hypothetical protein HPP92_015651 [Vanilla planifolia]|uniref:Uncharacterized protein n=1 Tax=Vanilla planifolia TaxID=51239 RepID=A0A835QJK4_VANPL|nr:hypothetical protein HPP92_015651 [Vanilla planifolia]